MYGNLKIKWETVDNKDLIENMGVVVADNLANSSTAVAEATKFNNFGRAVAALTRNTFSDAVVSVEISTEEILA